MPVADQAVLATLAVLARQQLGGRQDPRQMQDARVLLHDLGAVAGVARMCAMPPAEPLRRELGERHPADPGEPGGAGQHRGRRDIQQQPQRERGDQHQRGEAAE